LDKISSYTN